MKRLYLLTHALVGDRTQDLRSLVFTTKARPQVKITFIKLNWIEKINIGLNVNPC